MSDDARFLANVTGGMPIIGEPTVVAFNVGRVLVCVGLHPREVGRPANVR